MTVLEGLARRGLVAIDKPNRGDDRLMSARGISLTAAGRARLAEYVAADSDDGVSVVHADFNDVDTTQISNREAPILKSLAIDYAEAVIEGENTVAARVRLLRTTTRVLLVVAGLVAIANAAAQF